MSFEIRRPAWIPPKAWIHSIGCFIVPAKVCANYQDNNDSVTFITDFQQIDLSSIGFQSTTQMSMTLCWRDCCRLALMFA
jgi:hypothetical protein